MERGGYSRNRMDVWAPKAVDAFHEQSNRISQLMISSARNVETFYGGAPFLHKMILPAHHTVQTEDGCRTAPTPSPIPRKKKKKKKIEKIKHSSTCVVKDAPCHAKRDDLEAGVLSDTIKYLKTHKYVFALRALAHTEENMLLCLRHQRARKNTHDAEILSILYNALPIKQMLKWEVLVKPPTDIRIRQRLLYNPCQ